MESFSHNSVHTELHSPPELNCPIRPILSEFHVYLHNLCTAAPCFVTPAHIFFHHRADFLSLHHKFLLLQPHLFFLSLHSQNILRQSVCCKILSSQAGHFLLTDYLQLPISVSLILSLPVFFSSHSLFFNITTDTKRLYPFCILNSRMPRHS